MSNSRSHRMRTRALAAALPALLTLLAAACGDAGPTTPRQDAPRLDDFTVSPGDVAEPSGDLLISYTMFDTAGVTRSVLTLSGAVSKEIEANEQGVRTGTRYVRVTIPAEAQPGTQLTVKLTIFNAKSLSDSRTAPPITIVDNAPPRVTGGPLALSGYVAGTSPEVAKGVGETLGIEIRATDNNRLTWVGYRLGAPAGAADSVAVAGPTGAFDPRLTVPAAWIGSSTVTLFARDASGRLTEFTPTADKLLVYPIRTATPRSAPLAELPTDYAYDARRELLYLLLPGTRSVAVFSVATLAYESPIVFAETPGGIDLTLSDDSLLVTLPEARAIGVVDVAQAGRPASRIPLDYDTTHARKPEHLRVAANGKVLVSLKAGDATPGPRFVEYDLATGRQRPRTELGADGSAANTTLLVRSWSRSHILAINGYACCYGTGMVYVAARDVVTSGGGEGREMGPASPVGADSAGLGFLYGGRYVSADLSTSRWIAPPDFGGYYYSPVALSPDGTRAYFITRDGYKTVRVADGAMLEKVLLPASSPDAAPLEQMYRMFALPDGNRLVGWTWNGDKLLVISPR